MEKVIRRVLRKISPSKKESDDIRKISLSFLGAVRKYADKYSAETILAGSITRNTWLKDKKEIDIFIALPESVSESQLEKIGLSVGKAAIKSLGGRYVISFAQHPYVRGRVGKYEVDIVPCYNLSSAEKIKSAVDRTPFHVRFIENNMDSKQSDDVRLLKQFCKSIGVYGADLKTEGIPGYLCDLLVIKYGSFASAIKAISEWKPGHAIRFNDAKSDSKFEQQPFILIDPVDPKRNVAAALSPRNFEKLVRSANAFCEKPSEKFFSIQAKRPMEKYEFVKLIKARKTRVISITFKPPKTVPDILWPQLRRATERIAGMLRENDFRAMKHASWTDENKTAVILLEMEVFRLPDVKKMTGPSVFAHANARNFIERYDVSNTKPYIEGVNWMAEIKRKYTDASAYVKIKLSQNRKTLADMGIPSHIADAMSGGFKVNEDGDLYEVINSNKGAKAFVRDFFGR
ncbi:MAG: CCA tRNA nucleotidyltransferase [Candidatus Aenigmatarchaeota archaeon]